MQRGRRHIATLLLGVLAFGTIAAPVAHRIIHAAEQRNVAELLGHVHPDYKALLDGSVHALDTHLECVLCSHTYVALHSRVVHENGLARRTVYPTGVDAALPSPFYENRSIRGPPVPSTS